MKRRNRRIDYSKREIWRRLVASYHFPAIRLNNNGETFDDRKRPQRNTRWKDKGTGDIIGITEAEKIHSDRYGFCPHTAGLLCGDIDTVPGMAKHEFRQQSKPVCQRQLKDYVYNDLFARCPELKRKLVFLEFSESGKGIHIYFWQDRQELRTGKTKEPYGDCFNGDGYVIPSDVKGLLLSLELNFNLDPLSEDEIRFLTQSVTEPSVKASKPASKPSHEFTGFPSAEELYSLFHDRPLQYDLVMRTVKQACGDYWHRPLSLNPDYPWLGEELAIQFAGVPIEIFDAYVHWWMIAKILKHVNPHQIGFRVFDSLSALSWNYGQTVQMWSSIDISSSKPVNMGRIVSLNKLFDGEILINSNPKRMDYAPADEWFLANTEIQIGGWIAKDELYRHFKASNPDSDIGQSGFSAHMKQKFKLVDKKRKGKRGFAGPVLR